MTPRATLLSLSLVAACALDLAPRPVARVHATPDALAQDDGFRTLVTLDGRGSRDDFGDPPAALSYAWSLGAGARVERADAQNALLFVRFAGERPPTVTLTVTTADGRQGETTARIALTTR